LRCSPAAAPLKNTVFAELLKQLPPLLSPACDVQFGGEMGATTRLIPKLTFI
jgi:hypothetical protein